MCTSYQEVHTGTRHSLENREGAWAPSRAAGTCAGRESEARS